MNKIFILPSIENKWIENNDVETPFSEIEVNKQFCIVPRHIYEDSLMEEDIDVIEKKNHIIYFREHFFKYSKNSRMELSRL